MKEIILMSFVLILNLCFIKASSIKCGDQQIDNCKECGQGEESNTCTTCEVEYFPFFENKLCIRCDDSIYGQIGCKGECISEDYFNLGFVYCKECKEGYYNLEGICYRCDTGSPGCSECSYEKEGDNENKIFKCKKCLNKEEYRLNENFRCVKCNENLENCKKCNFTEDEGFQAQCTECSEGYYLNSEKTCSRCYDENIEGGTCHICSIDSKPDYCSCYSGYILRDFSCLQCPDNCDECEFSEENNSTKCLRCIFSYTLNSANQCIPCEEGCRFCYLDKNDNPICLSCYSNKFLSIENNKCFNCPDRCIDCYFDNNKNEVVCIKCDNCYALNPINNQCRICFGSDVGYDCGACEYNFKSEKYECKTCWTLIQDSEGDYYSDSVYVTNTLQCEYNIYPEINGLYGCLNAEYIEETREYKCLQCKNYTFDLFIPVITDNSCIKPLSVGLSDKCLEAEKIGENYSCTKCDFDNTIILNISANIKQCYERKDNLSYCLEGKLADNNLICTKCVNNSELNENNICKCKLDSFSKDTKHCYKCNDINIGNPGCDESKGCEYFSANDQLNCKKCKDGYFEYTKGQCFVCSNEIPNCNKCHYDTQNKKLICDSCLDNMYILNKESNECYLNECEEYPDISPGCIICKDKLKQYKDNNKCQSLKQKKNNVYIVDLNNMEVLIVMNVNMKQMKME